MTTRKEISDWFDEGVRKKASHMIVKCDTFSYEDFPSYAKSFDVVQESIKNNGHNMNRIMEIYNLKMDRDKQLDEHRAYNI